MIGKVVSINDDDNIVEVRCLETEDLVAFIVDLPSIKICKEALFLDKFVNIEILPYYKYKFFILDEL